MGYGGLHISTTGLLAAQLGLEVTSNNIANANTKGYTRRLVEYREGVSSNTSFNINERLLSGVHVESIYRARDSFLDNQVRQQNGNHFFNQAVADVSIAINNLLGEPSDSGLSAKLNQFYNAASDLAANPELETAKAVFINAGSALADIFNQIDQSFDIYKTNISQQPSGAISAKVNQLNDKLAKLVDIHRVALVSESLGTDANSVFDERDSLLDDISQLIDVNIERDGSGNLVRLSKNINATEARATGTVSFLNNDSPLAAITAGNNTLDLSINDGNGNVTGPFTVNFDVNSSPRQIVDKINATFKAAGGQGEIASIDNFGFLNLSTRQVSNSVNNNASEVNIIGGSGTTLTTLGLTAGVINGSDATKETIMDSRGVHIRFEVGEGSSEVGTNPNRLEAISNNNLNTFLGTFDNGVGGEIGGMIHASNNIIPRFQNELSDFAMSIKDSVNKVLQLGLTENGNQGAPLFVGTDAGNFAVDESVITNPGLIAHSKTGAVGDGSIASEVADLFFGSNHIVSDLALYEETFIDSPGAGPVTPVSSQIALVPGETITVHAEGIIDDNGSAVNAGQNGFGTGSLVQIQFRDATGALVGGPVDFPASAGAPEDTVSYTGIVPVGAASIEFVMNGAFNDGDLTNNFGHFKLQVLQGADTSYSDNFNTRMADIVGDFGTQGNVAVANAQSSDVLLTSLSDRRDGITGVSVEEEAATLIQLQNAFAANARVIGIWDEVYETIVSMF